METTVTRNAIGDSQLLYRNRNAPIGNRITRYSNKRRRSYLFCPFTGKTAIPVRMGIFISQVQELTADAAISRRSEPASQRIIKFTENGSGESPINFDKDGIGTIHIGRQLRERC